MSDLIGRYRYETFFNTEHSKRFFLSSKMVWGPGARDELFNIISEGATVGLFFDEFFARDSFVQAVRERVGDRLVIDQACYALPKAQTLIEIANKTSPPDLIVSVGGGSTIDAAKAVVAQWIFGTIDDVGMGAKRGMPWLQNAKRPLIVGVPTTAGTGADASRYYVTYDLEDKGKIHGKSWDLTADWILIDPYFLRSAPDDLLILSAFDAFVHFFESFICRFERSWAGDLLSVDGIGRVLVGLKAVLAGDRSDDALLQLHYAAAMGGVAISNIRTGNIHEAAGALLELIPSSHAETLFVFFDAAYVQYRSAIGDREALLMRHLAAHFPELGFSSFDEIRDWWRGVFEQHGLKARIGAAMATVTDWNQSYTHIFDRTFDDKVWCDKESPIPMDAEAVGLFIRSGLLPFLPESLQTALD